MLEVKEVKGMRTIQRRFMETLGKVWYNFDALKAARTRAFKSWPRLQRSIEDLTWSVVNATDKYVRELEELEREALKRKDGGRTEAENVREYDALLKRLRL